MQGDNEVGDYISRAKAVIASWRAQYDGQQRASRFDACTNDELVCIAETGRTLDGQKLTACDRHALHGVWQAMFGEGLGARASCSGVPAGVPEASPGQHPLLALPDDQMIRPRDVVRLCGIPRSTLKRWRREGRFPKPQRISPQSLPIHVGWPARQIKAWLREGAR